MLCVTPMISPPTNVHGQAAQPADDRGRERVDDEQGQHVDA